MTASVSPSIGGKVRWSLLLMFLGSAWGRFSVPACAQPWRRAQGRSRLADGHRRRRREAVLTGASTAPGLIRSGISSRGAGPSRSADPVRPAGYRPPVLSCSLVGSPIFRQSHRNSATSAGLYLQLRGFGQDVTATTAQALSRCDKSRARANPTRGRRWVTSHPR